MKKIALLFFILAAMVPSGMKVLGIPGDPEDKREAIIGAWVHRGFYYVFQDSVMTAVKISGEPKGFKSFRYTLEALGNIDLIRYGADLADTRNNEFLLLGTVTDSTAVIAYATPFVRADSSKGFVGTWKNVVDMKAIVLTVGAGTIDYSEIFLDGSTGRTVTTEQRLGFYRGGKGRNSGKFYISFDDGSKATLLPIIFGDVMYLFDISPRKSVFMKTDRAPTFREFQQAAESNG